MFQFPSGLPKVQRGIIALTMSLEPTLTERLNRARADLRIGLPVILGAEGMSLLAASPETLTQARWADLQSLGPLQLALTAWRAETLHIPAYDGDLARVVVPAQTDLARLHALADPQNDLDHPMKGPFEVLREGPADLHRAAIQLAKTAQLLPAVVTLSLPQGLSFAAQHGLTFLPITDCGPELFRTGDLFPLVSARVPMQAAKAGRLHIFRPDDGTTEHYAVEIGTPSREAPVLARLHSACFTGDVLGSLKCDCGPQLNAALQQMGEEGAGVLLYLNQEGRGIGLANKMRAYSLQDQGFDTVEANHRLGFEDDERDFRIGAAILRQMGFKAVRLLTNNPKKLAMMQAQGLQVTERVALKVGQTPENRAYLATKATKSGHLL